ncbi:MAG: cobyrinic acid a,c-diamide synthase, partial [Pseudomonadota bacterium]
HMGLVPPLEHPRAEKAVDEAAGIVRSYVDVDSLWAVATQAPCLEFADTVSDVDGEGSSSRPSRQPRIGLIRDSAFWFYYRDNLEALQRLGAKVVECSALVQDKLPPIDALYIGGGFPETHAET